MRLSAGRSTVVSVARAVSVKGAPAAAVGTSRWRTGSRNLSLDVHCARTSGGGGRCEDGRFGLVCRADTHLRHLTAGAPPSSCRMTAWLDQVPESSRRLVPWLQVTAKFRSQQMQIDKALRMLQHPGAWLISRLCNRLFHVPCAGGHPCGPGPRLPFLACPPGRNGSRPREKGSAKGICVGG